MRAKWLRLSVIAGLSAFLLVFFVPFIAAPAVAPPVVCSAPGPGGFEFCSAMIEVPPGSLNYLSLGFYLVHWGATNTYINGYTPPTITYPDGAGVSTLTTSGVISFVVLPVIAVSIALLGFRKVTALASLSLLGWGLLIMVVSLPQHDTVLSAYGYLMTVSSGAGMVAALWGRKIMSYWRMDTEVMSSDP